MAKKKPITSFSDKQPTEKQAPTNLKSGNKTSLIPLIIVGLYMAVHFITNMNAIDVMGPQWLFIGILNLIGLLVLFRLNQKEQTDICILVKPLFTKILFLLFFLAALSIPFSINKIESIVCYARFSSTVIAYINILFFFLLYDPVNTFRNICRLLALITISESSIAVYKYVTDGIILDIDKVVVSITANTGNKNIFAASLAIKLPFILHIAIHSKSAEKIFYTLSIIMGVTVILLLGARASYLSVLIFSTVYIAYIFFNKTTGSSKKYSKILLVCHLLIPLLLGFIAASLLQSYVNMFQSGYGAFSSVASRLTDVSTTNESSSYRLMLWRHAFDYISQHPFMGCGYGNWKLASIPYEKEFINDLTVPAHAHNDFIEHTAELGMFGGILYLTLFISIIVLTIKTLQSNASDEVKSISFYSALAVLIYAVDASLNFPIERAIMQVFFAFSTALNVGAYIISKKVIVHKNKQKSKKSLLNIYLASAIIISISATYINNLVYISLKGQLLVVPDLKNEPMSIPLAEVKTMFPPIPNLTSSSQPIDAILGRYHSENKQYDEALRLLRKSIPYNPHIYYSQFLMANVFFNTDRMDSAKYYAEMAYYNKPRANTYYQTLVAVHAKRRDTAGVAKAFRTYVKYRNEAFAWNLFLMGMLNAQQKATPELLKLADSALTLFGPQGSSPAGEADYANLLKRKQEITNNLNFAGAIGNSPEQNAATLQKATQIYNEGVAAFAKQDYATAAAKFVRAAQINAFNYAIYENAGVSYFNLKQYRKAIFYFDKVIALKITNDGKSEFFKGVSHINLGEKEIGCQTLQIAKSKNYADANNIIAQYCNK